MKPTQNSYFCIDCNRPKMVFSSKEKAERFIDFNADEINEETGRRPVRAYYCIACGGWHITSHEAVPQKRSLVERYFYEKDELIGLMNSLGLKVWSKNTIVNNISIHVGNFYHQVEQNIINVEACQQTADNLIKIFDYISHTSMKTTKEIQKAFSKFLAGCRLLLERKGQMSESLCVVTR